MERPSLPDGLFVEAYKQRLRPRPTVLPNKKRPSSHRTFHPREGRPDYEPDDSIREWVKLAIANGATEEMICKLIINPRTGNPITNETLRKYYGYELECGGVEPNLNVGLTCYQLAVGDPGVYDRVRRKWIRRPRPPMPSMIQWWEQTRGGRSVNNKHEHSGPNGKELAAPTIENKVLIVLPANGRETGVTADYSVDPRWQASDQVVTGSKKGNGVA